MVVDCTGEASLTSGKHNSALQRWMRHLTKSTPSGGRQALSAAEGSGTTAADGAGPTDNVLGSGWGLEHLWHDGCISWASVLEKAAGLARAGRTANKVVTWTRLLWAATGRVACVPSERRRSCLKGRTR